METIERLGRRIAAAEGLREVVRTMKTLSAIGVRRFEQAAEAVRGYSEVVELGLVAALRETKFGPEPPPEEAARGGLRALIAIGADHGLCGRFDDAVAGLAREAAGSGGVPVAAVGLRLADRLAGGKAAPGTVHATPGSVRGLAETADALLVGIDAWRREKGVVEVLLLHNAPSGDGAARPVSSRLLPVSPAWLRDLAARPWPGRGLPMLFDARERVLAHLIRQHLHVRLHRALAESLAAEHAARLAVMQGAERNIAEHIAEMQAGYRARRQEGITTELLEVAAGYAALGGGETSSPPDGQVPRARG